MGAQSRPETSLLTLKHSLSKKGTWRHLTYIGARSHPETSLLTVIISLPKKAFGGTCHALEHIHVLRRPC